MSKTVSPNEAMTALNNLRIKSAVGDYILLFGSTETVLGWFITHVSKSRFSIGESEKYEKYMEKILSKYNNFNVNVEIAEYLINQFQEKDSEQDWADLIAGLKYSMERRNFYAHNMHKIKDNKDLVKLKVSRSNRIENHYVDISVEEIEKDYVKLVKIYADILEYIISETDKDGNLLPDVNGGIKLPKY